jgi:hypothetical protein
MSRGNAESGKRYENGFCSASPEDDDRRAPDRLDERSRPGRWASRGRWRNRRARVASRVVLEEVFIVRALQQIFVRSALVQDGRSSPACLARVEPAARRRGAARGARVGPAACDCQASSQRITDRELIVMPFRLWILPVAASPTQSSTRFGVVFRKREVFSVVAPFDAADLRAGWNIDLDSEPSAMRFSIRPTEYWKRCGEFEAGLMRRPASATSVGRDRPAADSAGPVVRRMLSRVGTD